jgi:predicted nucleic acid-binding protein
VETTVLGFVRLTTHRQVLVRPLPVADATALGGRSGLSSRLCACSCPVATTPAIACASWRRLGVAAGNLTSDAHLAALALDYQADTAVPIESFSRFPGLRVAEPVGP